MMVHSSLSISSLLISLIGRTTVEVQATSPGDIILKVHTVSHLLFLSNLLIHVVIFSLSLLV